MTRLEATGHLPPGLPIPVPEVDGLSGPYWQGLREGRLLVQRCPDCATWQFGPEWLCHHCHRFDPDWVEIAPRGLIHSWTRVWHAAHPALRERCPYVVVVVVLAHAGGIRMVGNLLGAGTQEVPIGAEVAGVHEHHRGGASPFSLLQWERTGTGEAR